MTRLTTGGNTLLLNGRPQGVVVDVTWDSGAIPCEAVMFVCGPSGRVLSNDYFVFHDMQRSPGGEVFHRSEPAEVAQRAQFLIHMAALPSAAEQMDVVLATRERDLEHVTDVQVLVWDPASGRELARYDAPSAGAVRSTVLGRFYLHAGVWKFMALEDHHDRDVHAVAQEYGVSF